MRRTPSAGPAGEGVDRIVKELVASSADPAYATTKQGRIVAWNRAASELLGYNESEALKAFCWRLLAGLDVYGNPLCGPRCPLVDAARRGIPVHRFVLNVRAGGGHLVRVKTSIVSFTDDSGERALVHLMNPCCVPDGATSLEDIERVTDEAGERQAAARKAVAAMSRREIEILRFIAVGHSTREVAQALCISPQTVRHHVRNILSKLGVHSRLAAVYAARDAGLL